MVGLGYDLHRLEQGRRLLLGGVQIDCDFGCVAHSDGDVLIHSLIDALLGAAGLGDIGEHFPDNSNEWKDANSVELLKKIMYVLRNQKHIIINIDATIILEKPKLSPYKQIIRENLANVLGITSKQVSIKAKTNEGVDSTGRGESIAALVVCQLEKETQQ
jgi:2-C-methyl-D-erythritol 2,4-cyclodiphosphate synthase